MRARAATIVCTWWVVRWAAGLASGAAVHSSGAWAVQAASSVSCTARLRLWGAGRGHSELGNGATDASENAAQLAAPLGTARHRATMLISWLRSVGYPGTLPAMPT